MTDVPTNNVADRKKTMRTNIGARMASLDGADRHDASVRACGRIMSMDEFRHASAVMLYMPLTSELDVTPLAIRCFQLAKTVCVPRVDTERIDMRPVEVSTFDNAAMALDQLGVRTPRDAPPVMPELLDLVIVPGIAFDLAGHRLGRGKGYYDRFLRRLRRAVTTVGIAFETQIVDDVPVEAHDTCVDLIVTERRTARVQRSRSRR